MSIKFNLRELQNSTFELYKQVREIQGFQNKVINNQNIIINAVKNSANPASFNTSASNQESSMVLSQDYDYVPSIVGNFQLVTDGKTWKYNKATGLITLNTGDPITFGIFDDSSVFNTSLKRVAIVNKGNNLFLRHLGTGGSLLNSVYLANNWDYSWLIHKTESGLYELHNDWVNRNQSFAAVYSASNDRIILGETTDPNRIRFSITGSINSSYLTPSFNGLRYQITSGYNADTPTYITSRLSNKSLVLSEGICKDISNINIGTLGRIPLNGSLNNYSVQWLGYFLAPTTGRYTFFLSSDDGSFLWIGTNALSGFTTTNALIKNGGIKSAGMVEASAQIDLTGNTYYPIRIQFSENTGGDNCIFSYIVPGEQKTTSNRRLFTYAPLA